MRIFCFGINLIFETVIILTGMGKTKQSKDVTQKRIFERTETSSQNGPLMRTVKPTQIMELEVRKFVLPERILETFEAVTLVQRARVQQLTAEQIGDVPQFREDTVDEISLVPRERAQQWTAEQNREVHQFREKTAGGHAGPA